MHQTHDINISRTIPLQSPKQLSESEPLTDAASALVVESREIVKAILAGEDERLLVVVGPCSIHDPKAAVDYAQRLSALAKDVRDRLFLVMRVYFEKPRTTVGWKGLINDPHLDDSFDIAEGLRLARHILLQITELGLPAATEMLEPVTPQYIADLISLASIGARTTESPTHRQMASGLSMPVGYKNGTDGGLEVALNAMLAAKSSHQFLGIDSDGRTCVVETKGNPWGHLILRGGRSGPNYHAKSLADAEARLRKADLSHGLLVDCSHANSGKDPNRQPEVWNDVLSQRLAGNPSIIGMMLESNLGGGNQKLSSDLESMTYGVSVTDGCLSWEATEALIRDAYVRLG
jgi:3-deoxy-7-phosphoheptulonate synthase